MWLGKVWTYQITIENHIHYKQDPAQGLINDAARATEKKNLWRKAMKHKPNMLHN